MATSAMTSPAAASSSDDEALLEREPPGLISDSCSFYSKPQLRTLISSTLATKMLLSVLSSAANGRRCAKHSPAAKLACRRSGHRQTIQVVWDASPALCIP